MTRVKKSKAQVTVGVRRWRDDFAQKWDIWEGTLIALWEILAHTPPLPPVKVELASVSFCLSWCLLVLAGIGHVTVSGDSLMRTSVS